MSFTDVYGEKREAGEEWVVDRSMAEMHLLDVHEEMISFVDITVLAIN